MQADKINRADAALSTDFNADVSRQVDSGLTYAALNFGVEILFPVAGEVQIQLSSAHINFQIPGDISEVQVPIVLVPSKMRATIARLADVQAAAVARVGVVNGGLAAVLVESEVGVHQMR